MTQAATDAIIENNYKSALRKNETATRIASAATGTHSAAYYTLSGRQLGPQPQGKGCYIVKNGQTVRKVVVR